MEEEKQSRVHLDLAQLIVNKLADGESHVSQEVALQVLKPLLEGHVELAILKRSKLPENWFTNEITPNNDLIIELSSYLQKIKFSESEFFIIDLEEKFEQFKAKIYTNNKHEPKQEDFATTQKKKEHQKNENQSSWWQFWQNKKDPVEEKNEESNDIFDKSQCSNDPQEKQYFKEIMGNKKFSTKLHFRASRDGQKYADFHRMVDGKAPTVSLFKIADNGQCVGGFTSAQWASPESITYVNDSTAMVFNLTTHQLFKSQYHSQAIECYKGYGPAFGYGELRATEPFNRKNYCYSFANNDVYRIQIDSGWFKKINKLTNLKCDHTFEKWFSPFTIIELEVWEVIFSD